MTDESKLQAAIFALIAEQVPLSVSATSLGLNIWHLRRAYHNWVEMSPETLPQDPMDIDLNLRSRGRPTIMTPDEEHLLAKAIKCFVDANLPLTLVDLKHLVQHYVTLLPSPRREEVPYVHTLPSKQWIRGFLTRHPELYVGSVRAIENKRIEAVTKDHICEHIAWLQAAMQRYNITNPKHIFNLDESGCHFAK